MVTPEPPDWDIVDPPPPDPEDTAERDGPRTHLDDVPDELPEEPALDPMVRHVEETIAWQVYNAPAPD